jgi:hypothetical protein
LDVRSTMNSTWRGLTRSMLIRLPSKPENYDRLHNHNFLLWLI